MTELRREELPIWMQKTMRGTDWGVLIVFAFSLLAAWSFLLQPGLPRTNDSEHYVYRTADYAEAFAEGRLYPRWSPNALSGYGAPIPNYYPPGAAFVPALLDYFLTNDATLAVKLVYVGAFCVAGTAVYAFVTRRSGAAAGVVAALLYVYSPYFGLVAPHLLGDLPGVISLALIPTLLWSVERLIRVNRSFDLALVACISAALILTDIPASIIGWMLAAALLAWNSADEPRWYLAPIGCILGIALAGCFWFPAIAESDAVQWYERPLTIRHTLSLLEMFAPLNQVDLRALIPTPQLTLGLAAPACALISIPVIVLRRAGFHALFLILGAALIVLALTVFTSEVWLLGVITLCLAVGGSAAVLSSKARLFLPMLVIVILIAAMPIWLSLRWSEAPIDASPAAQLDFEEQGFGVAVLPDGEALPASIPPDTPPNRDLNASYDAGFVNKLEPIRNAQIGVLEHDTHGDRFQVETLAPLTLHVLSAYFPGWSAHLNASPLNLSRSADGLIDVDIPDAVRGELTVSLGTTAPRTLGWVLSGLALLLLAVTTLRRSRASSDTYELIGLLTRLEARLLGIVLAGFAAALALFILPFAPLPTPVQPADTLAGASTLDDHSDAGLEVLAYRVNGASFHAGGAIPLTVYWHTLRFLTDNYRVRVSLLDLTTGEYRAPTDLRVPGGYPTARWVPRRYVIDPYNITIPADFPAGKYSPALEVCRADCAPESRLTFFDREGNPYGAVLVLPIILSVT